jgi:hypothetical protein
MAKIFTTICDVNPCKNLADREFQLNGQKIHVCGEGCYAKYWSREYRTWKTDRYDLQVSAALSTPRFKLAK